MEKHQNQNINDVFIIIATNFLEVTLKKYSFVAIVKSLKSQIKIRTELHFRYTI